MPNLIADTELEPTGEGAYRIVLPETWSVWGPNGGFLAAIALRAAMQESPPGIVRPASFHCDFLSVGKFQEAEVRVVRQGGSKRACSLRVEIAQEGRLLVSASVWMVSEGLRGYEHDFSRAPSVKPPRELQSYAEHADDYDQWFPIWRSIEGRPIEFRSPPGDPEWYCWLRFTETPIVGHEQDAMRQLYWLDMPPWNSTISAHSWPFPYLAPNLDLDVVFHDFAPEIEWSLLHGSATVAGAGIVGTLSRAWTEDGRLLATSTSKLAFRPNPGYEQELAMAREMGVLEDGEAP